MSDWKEIEDRARRVKLAQSLMDSLNEAINLSRRMDVKEHLEKCKADLLDILYEGKDDREPPA